MAIRAGIIAEKKNAAGKLTLRQAIAQYIAQREGTLSPCTVRGYDTIRRKRFPGKMDKPISQTDNWQSEIDAAAKKYAPKTIKNDWGLISTVMRQNNVSVPPIKIPQQKAAGRLWLDPEQILAFCAACRDNRAEREMLFALLSLRRSEILGLRWNDIDLRHNCINITQVIVPNRDNKFVVKESAKTEKSARTVPILIPRLRDLLQKPDGASDADRISSVPPNSLYTIINRVCRAANLPEVGVHGLRHSFASLAYFLGFREEECMRIGGWSDYKIMHEIYTHLYMRSLKEKENKMYQFYKTQGKLVLPNLEDNGSDSSDFRS